MKGCCLGGKPGRTCCRVFLPAAASRAWVTCNTSASSPLPTSAAASSGHCTAWRSVKLQLSAAASGARDRFCAATRTGQVL